MKNIQELSADLQDYLLSVRLWDLWRKATATDHNLVVLPQAVLPPVVTLALGENAKE